LYLGINSEVSLFSIFKRFLGGQKATAAVKSATRSPHTNVKQLHSTEAASLVDFELDSRDRIEAMSVEMPDGDYFTLLEKLQSAISEKRYVEAAEAAHLSIAPLRDWLSDPRGDGLNRPGFTGE
jgi:hypothetical protein